MENSRRFHFDHLIALHFGAAAVRMIEEKKSGTMVALEEVIGKTRNVPVDCDTTRTAREIGVSFGD